MVAVASTLRDTMRVGIFKSGSSSAGRPKSSPSNVRGRISGPIPILGPFADDEFPMRQSGTGFASPLANDGRNKAEGPSGMDLQGDPETVLDVVHEERTGPGAMSGPSPASNVSGYSPSRNARYSTLRYSIPSHTDKGRSPPQRKKSILRGAIGKLKSIGGLKKKGLEDIKEADSATPPKHYRSVSSALNRPSSQEGEPKRSVSVPITEYDRALRSHSIGPHDIIAIESARDSLQDESARNRRRAATAQATKSRDFATWEGLSPRPASTHGQANQEENPDDIGRAVTSDIYTYKRRSRSESQIRGIEVPNQRNRDDEIRYWRESYEPGPLSPLSSHINEDTGISNLNTPESQVEPNLGLPPQPLTFGPMAEKKNIKPTSLEERIDSLEVQNAKLEKLVSQLFNLVPGVDKYCEKSEKAPAPPRSSATNKSSLFPTNLQVPPIPQDDPDTMSRYTMSRDSHDTFGDEHTFVGSVAASPRPSQRPLSNATLRAASSLPALPTRDLSGPTSDHCTTSTLLALIESERSARQALEAEMTKLHHKISFLSLVSRKPPEGQPVMRSVFDHDDDEDETRPVTEDEDYSESEAFKTPQEQPQPGFGAFGEELMDQEADGQGKKAARTLSLSQMTMKNRKKAEVTS